MFETYFEKKAKEQKRQNIQGRKLAKEIIGLCFDLGEVIPYAVTVHLSTGEDISSVDVMIFNNQNDFVFNTHSIYFTGSICNIPKLKKLKANLQRAIKFCELPEAL